VTRNQWTEGQGFTKVDGRQFRYCCFAIIILSATDLANDQNCGNLTSSFCLRRIELTGGMHLP
jgi:hypothetical protein